MLGRRKRARSNEHVGPAGASDDGQRLTVAGGVRLWFRWAGAVEAASDRPTLVVPCCGNADDLAGLVTTERRVLFYDVRNRGRSDSISDPRRLGFGAELDDLASVCDELELERVSLLGWSYHAGVVTRFALTNPERVDRIVLAAAIPLRSGVQPTTMREAAPHQLAWLDQLQAQGLPASDPARWCVEWRKIYVPLRMGDPSGFERLHSPCAMPNEHPAHMARAVVFVLAELGSYHWAPELRELRAPVLVVHGTADADPIELADEWVRAIPDARLLPLDGVGQLPWAEAPDRFYDVVNRFLAGESV
jgi:proline iminopeptidase